MRINRLDHLVLTGADVEATVELHTPVPCMRAVTFPGDRRALSSGAAKIGLRPIVDDLDAARAGLAAAGVPVGAGPVDRTGAPAGVRSVYLRDPDENLIEPSTYDPGDSDA